jgi:hypothetical protein
VKQPERERLGQDKQDLQDLSEWKKGNGSANCVTGIHISFWSSAPKQLLPVKAAIALSLF